jgi:ribosomal protein L18
MPQANITYDAPYNKGLVREASRLQDKKWATAYPAFSPTELTNRLGSFHGERPYLVGGGSHPMKYNPAGNSPAYPPMSLSSGLAVNSGGNRYAGVDGAIGHPAMDGGRFNFGSILKPIAKIAQPIAEKVAEKAITKAVGLGRKRGGRTSGGETSGGKFNFGKVLGSVGKIAQPIAERVAEKAITKAVGLGRSKGGRNARAEIVKKVMREKGLKLIEASKYVKAHGLY